MPQRILSSIAESGFPTRDDGGVHLDTPGKLITLGRATFMDAPFVWTGNRNGKKGKENWTNNKAYSKPTLGFVEGY